MPRIAKVVHSSPKCFNEPLEPEHRWPAVQEWMMMNIRIRAFRPAQRHWRASVALLMRSTSGTCKVAPSVFLLVVALGIPFGDWAVQASEGAVRFKRSGEKLFVQAADIAEQLDLKLEIVQHGRLVTFCTADEKAICIPIRLTDGQYLLEQDTLMLAAGLVEDSLGVIFELAGDKLHMNLSDSPQDSLAPIPAYNEHWGTGRGFREGQTVPDIPLVDLDGREVRFSKFLGQRYILYCWASW